MIQVLWYLIIFTSWYNLSWLFPTHIWAVNIVMLTVFWAQCIVSIGRYRGRLRRDLVLRTIDVADPDNPEDDEVAPFQAPYTSPWTGRVLNKKPTDYEGI